MKAPGLLARSVLTFGIAAGFLLPAQSAFALTDAQRDCIQASRLKHTQCITDNLRIYGDPGEEGQKLLGEGICDSDRDTRDTAINANPAITSPACAPATVAPTTAAPATSSGSTTGGQTLHNPLGTSDLREVIGYVIKAALGLTGAAALLMFTWGGIQMLISGGSEERIKKGKSTLTWATIGLVVIFTAYTIVSAIVTALSSGSVT